MSEKLEILHDYQVAIISLSKEELARFNYKKGDTDMLANLCMQYLAFSTGCIFQFGGAVS